MVSCKHREMDKCKHDGWPCIYDEMCYEPEEQKPLPMTHEERYYIDLCRRLPDDFIIIVDNDGAFVQRLGDGECVCEFTNYGWRLALDLFRYIGCNAEEV